MSKDQKIKFSIITAVYNRSYCILNSIHSVRKQIYPLIEYIIIDASSTDGTKEIIESNLQSTDIFVSESDAGLYDALNKGINRATGEVIAFLHSDDVYFDENVINLVAKEFENEEISAVYGDVAFYDHSKKLIRIYRSGDFTLKRLSWGWMPAHPALFLRKSLYDKYGFFKTSYKIAADYEFLCRIMSSENIVSKYIPRILVNMSMGGVSTGGGFLRLITLNKEVLRACRENNIQTNLLKILSKYPFKLLQKLI